jgi:effector-binding domain-containing protein
MKVLKVIGILILVVVALGLIASLVLPKDMNVKSEATIAAPIDVVWNNINNFEKSDKWSPWYDVDPDMKVTFDGEAGTVGSSFSWNGNDQVGQGTQTITALDPDNYTMESKVKHNWGEGEGKMMLEDMGDGTVKVTTTYHEHSGIPGNLFSTLMDAEGMMGKMFDNGHSKLKVIAEEEAAATPEPVTYDVQEVEREARMYVGNKTTVSMADMGAYFMENMPKMGNFSDKAVGPPAALYWSWDTENMQSEMTAAMAVDMEEAPEGYELYEQPAGKYLLINYFGNYDQSEAAHNTMGAYMETNNLELTGAVMEEYITDPGTEPDTSKWQTNILYPVKAKEATEEEG